MGFLSNPLKAVKSFVSNPGKSVGILPMTGVGYLGRKRGPGAYNYDDSSQAMVEAPPPKSAQFLSNQQLSENLRNRIKADSLALKGSNYPTYKGQMVTPVSPLTEKAQALRQQNINKPLPYSNKVKTMLNKEATGFSPEQTRALLDMIGRGGRDQNEVMQRLEKQFGGNYGYEGERGARLQGKIGGDTTRSEENTLGNFKALNNEFKDVENRRNIDAARSFAEAGIDKSARRNAHINQLENFGNQDYGLRHLQNMARRDAFDEEVQMPYKKISSAANSLNSLGPEEDNPSMTELRNKELQRIQNAYNATYKSYPGERVVGMQPESQQAMNNALYLDPKYRDSYYADRKAIERNTLNNSLPNQVFNNIPEAADPLMKNLDHITQQQLKKQSKQIAGKHVRLGSFGSGSHKAETEKSLREILNRVRQEREGALTNVTKGETSLAARKEQTGLAKYKLMNMLGSQEFNNVLDRNRQLNDIGFNRRSHKQAEENSALREWYAQLQHSMAGANPGAYNNLAKQYSTDLSSLFNRPQAYNNNLQDYNQYRNNTSKSITDPASRRQLDEWEEQQRRAMMSGGYSPQYGGTHDNLRSQALALARATPVY
jgi:hypothetical protein